MSETMGIVCALRDSAPGTEEEDIPTNASLVAAALNGHSWAQETLFRRHVRMAGGLAHRLLLGSDIEADDIVQDAFIAAFSRLDSLRAPEAFGSWLGSIVVRQCSKKLRRLSLRLRLGLASREAVDVDLNITSAASPEVIAELKQIYGLLERLRPDERVALVLRRVEGMTVPEIAESMDTSVSTVKRRLSVAESPLARCTSDGSLSVASFPRSVK